MNTHTAEHAAAPSAPPSVSPSGARPGSGQRWSRAGLWLPGLAVAVGAAVATAHGLYEVAVAARVPKGIAWLYPLITDGLALVAYTATARLRGGAARYAWAVVIIAAGLSGLAQAMFLAAPVPAPGAAPVPAEPLLRFGVGAWPAVAAAVVAHLLYLLAAAHPTHTGVEPVREETAGPVAGPVQATIRVQTREPAAPSPVPPVPSVPVGHGSGHPERPVLDGPVIPGPSQELSHPVSHREPTAAPVVSHDDGAGVTGAGAPVLDRARELAVTHRARHGGLPTVRELEELAEVGRGTAARALKQLREQPQQAETGLHLVATEHTARTQP
ncbi:hypothetical protein [Pseudonocardia sp. HH130630-07]|uniref:hypothetical protein n=1 Tax=Pseudonocardia sp. HH130630-07 TaxID=1690815 RepID=UPI000814FFC5|nr:hypothetical protein [Pseudonocardia sp. HH130630-07]ANY06379.1 hypothetical protein AFB00_08830 [Pseudonocardia sp. HH130630-07]